jgi:hypothetical protein
MWSSGDTVALRYIRFGQVRRANPHRIIRDDGGSVALHIPVGAVSKAAIWDGPASGPIRGQADRTWELEDRPWYSYRVLRLIRFGDGHSVELYWHEEGDSFAGWYVNIQEPLRRSPVGFDTDDLVLDIWIEPDGAWQWKDEDELEIAVELGRFTAAEAAEIRAEGERVITARPWPTGWEDWKPDPAWPVPELPAGWDRIS